MRVHRRGAARGRVVSPAVVSPDAGRHAARLAQLAGEHRAPHVQLLNPESSRIRRARKRRPWADIRDNLTRARMILRACGHEGNSRSVQQRGYDAQVVIESRSNLGNPRSVLIAMAALCLVGCTDHRAAIHAAASNRARPAAPAGHWSRAAPMHTARIHATATVLDDGRVLVAGGYGRGSRWATLASAEIYDPRHDTWTRAAPLPFGRAGSAAVRLRDGSVLVAGGGQSAMWAERYVPAERYIPSSNTWVPAGRTAAREGESALLLRDGRVILLGGLGVDNLGSWVSPEESQAAIYDPRDNSWTTVEIPVPPPDIDAAMLGDGRILATADDVAAISDPQVASWKKVESWEKAAHPRSGAWPSAVGAILVSGGRVLVVVCRTSPSVAAAVLHDPGAGSWKRVASPQAPCTESSLTRMGDGRVMLVGATIVPPYANGSCRSAGQPQLYDASRNTWTTVPMPAPEPLFPTATAIQGGVLVIGGARCRADTRGDDIVADVRTVHGGTVTSGTPAPRAAPPRTRDGALC